MLFLCATKHHGTNAFEKMEVKFHAFLTPVLDVGEFSVSRICPLIRGKKTWSRVPMKFLDTVKYSQTYADVGN
jgi:hypothetical protein